MASESKTMSDSEQTSEAATPIPTQIEFHFIKANHFRVIHADGAWFGSNAHGDIHLTFYNERGAIPKKVVLKTNDDGTLASEDLSLRETKNGVVRELEADVVMSLNAANHFHRVLGQNLEIFNKNKKS